MKVKADIRLEKTKLLMQQSTTCVTELANDSRHTLTNVNSRNLGGSATLLITDVDSGEQMTISQPLQEFVDAQPQSLPDGQKLRDEFFLSDRFAFPKPGVYELRAKYVWDLGSTIDSDPVRVEVLPSRPRSIHVVTSIGGSGSNYHIAWINTPNPNEPGCQIWLTEIVTAERPQARQCIYLVDLDKPIQPVLSVPPNGRPSAVWVGWIDGSQLHFLFVRGSTVSDPSSAKLPASELRIVGPLLDNPVAHGGSPGFDVVLAGPGTGSGSVLFVSVAVSGKPVIVAEIDGPPEIAWGTTTYRSNSQRHTMLIETQPDASSLYVADWAPGRPPKVFKQVHHWSGRCIAAAASVVDDDRVCGAFLSESGSGATRTYSFHTWEINDEGGIDVTGEIKLTTPDQWGIDDAIVRVDGDGAPYAMIRTDGKQPGWYFAQPTGSVKPFSGPRGQFQLPGDILFRHGDEPVILFAVPELGFQLVNPKG